MRILIKNVTIITQNKKREIISPGFVLIKNNKFEKISKGNPVYNDLKKSDKTIDARGMLALPGLINAHVHLGETVFEDFFKGKYSLENYLKLTNELTKKTDLIESGREIIADYSLLNLMKKGTTTICGGRTAERAEYWGIRSVSGYLLMNSFKMKDFRKNAEIKFKEEYEKREKSKISQLALFIHSLNKVDLSLIKTAKKILKKYPKIKLILHIAETKNQEKEIIERLGKSSVGYLYQNGLLSDKTILIHGNWIDNTDMKLVKKSKASVVHCLSSNLKVADKTLNLSSLIKNGVSSCIATDGVVTSGTFSLMDEASKCFIYHNKNRNKNGGTIASQKILDLITIDAARVLGLERTIGSIENNKIADMILVEKNKFNGDIRDMLIGDSEVWCMILDGKLKICKSKVLLANEKEVINRFRTLTKRIKEEVK